MISVMCEQLYIGSKFSKEYLSLDPENILYQAHPSRQIIITNLNLKSRKRKIYTNPKDEILLQQSQNRTGDQLIRHQLFKIGLVGLECLTLCNVRELFVEGMPQQGSINGLIKKYRDQSGEEGQFINILEQFLQVNEFKRLSLDDLMDKIYYRGNLPKYGFYQGYYSKKGEEEKLPDGVGHCVINGWEFKGMFVEGQVLGRGIIYKDNRYISGYFDTIEQVQSAIVLDKNSFIYTGGVQNFKKEGEGAQIVLNSNLNQEIVYIYGNFHDDIYDNNKSYIQYQDGKVVNGFDLEVNSEEEQEQEDYNNTKSLSQFQDNNNSNLVLNHSQHNQNNQSNHTSNNNNLSKDSNIIHDTSNQNIIHSQSNQNINDNISNQNKSQNKSSFITEQQQVEQQQ